MLNIALFLPIDTEGGGLYDKAVEEVNALKKGMGNRIQVAQAGYSVISILFYFAAVLFLLFPHLPPAAICLFAGITMIAYGVIKIIGYFSEDLFCLAFRYDLAFGLFMLAIGCIILLKHSGDISDLPSGIGWLALLDCALKLQMSEEAKKFGLEQWNIISAAAAVTGVLGTVLIFKGSARPDSTRLLTALVLLAEGVMNHCVIKFAVKQPSSCSPHKKDKERIV